ncbi:DUF4426 domain-containing protein [Catenovulum agarivorans]|uniref:DUF4426 domain-containing protein n=1 Tax=Catenovulum agarivorans TaxID=1172192 RepID=UPI0003128E0B|nr:DUF4426 domain-containing protein [Catenovulum agarivorans]
MHHLKLFKNLILIALLNITSTAFANGEFIDDGKGGANPNMTEIGTWQIHHIAFPSTFIQPETAKAIGLDRRGNYGLLNISILDLANNKAPLKLKVTGYAQNLIGHRKELEFKEVDEGIAVYYLAQVRHSNEEIFRFYITVKDPKTGRTEKFRFQQKMWVD